jgi:hypothetical protein
VGDTVTAYNHQLGSALGTVLEVDSILIAQDYRRLLKLNFSGHQFEWISGIGCKSGLFFPGFGLDDNIQTLLCFQQDGQQVYENSPNGNCNYLVGLNEFRYESFKVYPNPAKGFLHLEFPEISEELNLYVLNSLGEVVHSEGIVVGQSRVSIEREGLASGLYSYRFENSKQTVQTGKFIFQ